MERLVEPGKVLFLSLPFDRTHWRLGRIDVNVLCLGLLHEGVPIPLESMALGKAGNSNEAYCPDEPKYASYFRPIMERFELPVSCDPRIGPRVQTAGLATAAEAWKLFRRDWREFLSEVLLAHAGGVLLCGVPGVSSRMLRYYCDGLSLEEALNETIPPSKLYTCRG